MHPSSPNLLTRHGPHIQKYQIARKRATFPALAHLKFESRPKVKDPRKPPIISFNEQEYTWTAFLRETSGETSNKMVRLAFHPCSKVLRAICTLAPNRPFHPVFTRLQATLAQFTIFRVVTLLLNRSPGQKAYGTRRRINFFSLSVFTLQDLQ